MITKVFKLTSEDHTTYNNTLWVPGEWRFTTGEGELCGPGWLHAYLNPDLAVLLNPIHAGFQPFVLWEAEAQGHRRDDRDLKVGFTAMRVIRQIEAPVWSKEEKDRLWEYLEGECGGVWGKPSVASMLVRHARLPVRRMVDFGPIFEKVRGMND